MRARWVIGVVAVLSTGGTFADAQEPRSGDISRAAAFVDTTNGVSLADAIATALGHDPAILGSRQQIEVARGERLQAGLRPNPVLGFEQRTEPAGTDSLTTVAFEWPLDLFRRPAREAVADARVRAAAHGVADRERTLVANVRASYGKVLTAVRDLEILDRLVGEMGRQRDVLAARVGEGRSAPLERDLLEVEVRRLDADRFLQLGKAEAALMELKRWLGMPSIAPLSVRERLEDVIALEEAGQAPAISTSERPDILEAKARVALADATVNRARQEGRFDVGLYGTYMRMDAGFPQAGFAPDGRIERVRGLFHYVSGGIRINLPVRNRNQGVVAAAEAEHAMAEASLDAVRLSADAERAAAAALDARTRTAVHVYRDGVLALARQNLRTVEQSYDLGRLTMLDVLTERRRYLDVERAYSEAMRAAFEARTAIVLATGGGR